MIFLTQGPLDAKKDLKQDMIKKCVMEAVVTALSGKC